MGLLNTLFNFAKPKKALVYYGREIAYEKFRECDYIILQGAYIESSRKEFLQHKKNVYAYVSVGEISREVQEYAKLKEEWVLSQNQEWQSDVLDIRAKECQEFLFEEVIEPLYKKGFENFFFDTLDSYKIFTNKSSEQKKFEESLIVFIKKFAQKYPKAKLIINRGFELIDEIHTFVEAVLFESYYFGLGDAKEPYKKVSKQDREWLDSKLAKVKYYNLPIIALDYLDEKDFGKAEEAMQVIRKEGMIPYISNRSLDVYGVC